MNKPLISVIVPVYRVEKYIRRCLDSLVSQTCGNFEVITVDDGSPDSAGRICDEYADRYRFVKSFHKTNGGLSSARNFGITAAEGGWIAFVDSDDWVEAEYIETCVSAIMEHPECDCVSFGYSIDYPDNKYALNRCYPETSFFSRRVLPDAIEIMEQRGMLNIVWNKIYKKTVLGENKLFFEEQMEPGEDLLFNCRFFMVSLGCLLHTQQLYHYMRQDEITLTKKYDARLSVKINRFDSARVNLYRALKMEAYHYQRYLLQYYYSYVLSALYNNYAVNAELSRSERKAFWNRIFCDDRFAQAVEIINESKEKMTGYQIIFFHIYSGKNETIADAVYYVLFWMRNHLKWFYNRFRKKQAKT